jgi:uncharacterized membrane protein YbhN (UPF0104 family)
VLEVVLRLAGAIALDTLALTVWNVGTRPPGMMLRDIVRGIRRPRILLFGLFCALVGLVFVAAATILLVPAVGDAVSDFVPLEIFTFLTALGIEYLIGNDLRRLATRLGSTPKTE